MNPKHPNGLKVSAQLMFLLLAAGIIGLGYFSYRNYEQTYRAEAEDQLMAVAELKVSELLSWRRERLGDGRVLYNNPAFSTLVQRFLEKSEDFEANRLLEAWMSKIHEQYSYAQIILMDTAGVIRLAIPRGVTVNPDLAQDLARGVPSRLGSGQVSFLDFHRHAAESPVHLAVTIPIFDDRGDRRRLGHVIFSIDPGIYLYPFIARWPTLSPTAETLIIRREGNEVVFLNELRFKANTAINLRYPLDSRDLPAAMAALGKEGIMEGVDYRGVPVLAALRIVPGSPWALVAKRDTEEVFGPLRERLWMTILLTISLLFGAGAGSGLLWRQQHLRFYREQSETVKKLQESEERYRTLFEKMAEGYCVIEIINDENGKAVDYQHVEINPAFIEQTGLSDALNKTMREMIPDLEGFWFETYAQVARTGKSIRFEHEATELQRHFSVFAYRLGGEGSRRVGIAFTDITERKKADKVILEQLDELSRWHEAMMGRENRIIETKREVNELLARLGEPPRYASATENGRHGVG